MNIECDMIGKYIQSFVANSNIMSSNLTKDGIEKPSKIDMNFLASNGFL